MLIFAFLTGCGGGSVAEDAARYAAVLGDEAAAPADALAACRKISDEALAGDCGLAVAQRAARDPGADPAAWCGSVAGDLWRSECYFQAAEAMRRRRDEERAAELCARAGPFLDDCAQHLWQTEVHQLAPREGGFGDALPAAQAVYDRWAPRLADTSDLSDRFWRRFYQNGFEGTPSLDPARCDGLPEDHAARCLAAAVDLFDRDLAPRLDHAGALADYCAQHPPALDALGDRLGVRPHPALDAVLVARQPELCGGG